MNEPNRAKNAQPAAEGRDNARTHPRREARILAMQALCQWEGQREVGEGFLLGWFGEQQAPPDAVRYAVRLVNDCRAMLPRIEKRLEQASPRWSLSRMSMVERNLLRIATLEMLGGDVPPAAAINEAIEIAREYGGPDSPRFVNGVLDNVLQRIREETGEAPPTPVRDGERADHRMAEEERRRASAE